MVAYDRTISRLDADGNGTIVVTALPTGRVEIHHDSGTWRIYLDLDGRQADVTIGQGMQPRTALLALAAMRVVEAIDQCGETCYPTHGASSNLLQRAERYLEET